MLNKLKHIIALDNPLRLLYHKCRAIMANITYGFPSRNMVVIGVTGTNGKTTTCNIIAKALRESGKKICMFTTVNIIIGDEEYTNETKMTSPDAFELQRILKIAKNEGCEYAIIETASHGIKMHRIWWIDYDICVLTNITQDHLDLHRTMKDYVHTKLKIFKELIQYRRKPGVKKGAVINMDSNYAALFLAETYDQMYTYGTDYKANLKAEDITHDGGNTSFTVKMANSTLHITTPLIWDFNIMNILAAIGVCRLLNTKPKDIESAIAKVTSVPGRMEEVINTEGYRIFIDYAHTEDALEKVLTTIEEIPNRGEIICVFWATGDRDKTKRPIMGGVVSRYADHIILTQDDDYSEKTANIIKDILPGIERKEGENFWIISDRKEAIRTALVMGKKDDIILIAGKGDEHSMITNNGPIEWHDKSIVEEILQWIDDNKIM